ncbi:MAG: hypothetical protein R3C68_14085, partial [Myxococcota bacterium]
MATTSTPFSKPLSRPFFVDALPNEGRSIPGGLVWALAAVLTVTTAVLVVITDGNIGAALAPIFVLTALFAAIRLPVRYVANGLLCAVLLFHNPGTRPMEGHWRGLLFAGGELLYNNLRHVVGIDALRFCAIELCLALMLGIIVMRTLAGDRTDAEHRFPAHPWLRNAVLLSFATVVFSCGWGLARGGDFNQLLWQVRQIAWLPAMAAVYMRALKTPQDYRVVGGILLTVAFLRALEGLYFLFAIAKPQGLNLEYV